MAKRQRRPPEQRNLDQSCSLDLDDCEIHVCLASWPESEALPIFQRMQIADRVAGEFRAVAAHLFDDVRRRALVNDLVLHGYTAGAKLDPHELEHLDLRQHRSVRRQIASLSDLDDLPLFSDDDDFLRSLRFYVIVILPPKGKPIYCFRSCNERIELRRSRLFGVTLARGQYDQFRNQLFLFDRKLDCFCYGSTMFIISKDRFERIFRFFEMVRAAARETLESIRRAVPIYNFDDFVASCEGHLQMLRKLKNIASQPYLERITVDDMKKVIADVRLPIDIESVNGDEKLVFDPQKKWMILKLLDDDYLKSVMTGSQYEVNSKRPAQA